MASGELDTQGPPGLPAPGPGAGGAAWGVRYDSTRDHAPISTEGSAQIIEAQEGGILPVTVRNVEAALQGKGLSVAGQHMRVDASDGVIAKWLRNIDKADDYEVDEVKRGAETVRINQTGAKPILTQGLGAPLNIGLPGKGAIARVEIPLALAAEERITA